MTRTGLQTRRMLQEWAVRHGRRRWAPTSAPVEPVRRIVSVSAYDAWAARVVDQFKPRPALASWQPCFFAWRYEHDRRLFVIDPKSSIATWRALWAKIQAEQFNLYRDFARQWPSMTVDRFRWYLSDQTIPLRKFCLDNEHPNPPLFFDVVTGGPRFFYDPETGERLPVMYGGQGQTYHIAIGGSDANPGTEASPWATLGKARDTLVAGDLVLIHGGTYDQTLLWDSSLGHPNGGDSWLSPVTFKANPGDTVILRPVTATHTVIRMYGLVRYVIWDSIEVDAIDTPNRCFQITQGDVGNPWPHHTRATNCTLKNARSQAWQVFSAAGETPISGGHELLGCLIEGIGLPSGSSTFAQAGYIASHEAVVEGNHVHTCDSGLNIFVSTQAITRDGVMRLNRCHDITPISGGAGLALNMLSNDGLLYNNLVYAGTWGIRAFGNGQRQRFFHNTVHGIETTGIEIQSDQVDAEIKNNISFNNGANISNASGSTVLANNVTANPSFVNALGGDFHLQSGSTAIGAGQDLSGEGIAGLSTDFDGIARPQGGDWDAGAFEFLSVVGGAWRRSLGIVGTIDGP